MHEFDGRTWRRARAMFAAAGDPRGGTGVPLSTDARAAPATLGLPARHRSRDGPRSARFEPPTFSCSRCRATRYRRSHPSSSHSVTSIRDRRAPAATPCATPTFAFPAERNPRSVALREAAATPRPAATPPSSLRCSRSFATRNITTRSSRRGSNATPSTTSFSTRAAASASTSPPRLRCWRGPRAFPRASSPAIRAASSIRWAAISSFVNRMRMHGARYGSRIEAGCASIPRPQSRRNALKRRPLRCAARKKTVPGRLVRQSAFLSQIRFAWDAANTFWNDQVVEFGEAQQRRLLSRLGIEDVPGKISAGAVGVVAAVLHSDCPLIWRMRFRPRRPTPIVQIYERPVRQARAQAAASNAVRRSGRLSRRGDPDYARNSQHALAEMRSSVSEHSLRPVAAHHRVQPVEASREPVETELERRPSAYEYSAHSVSSRALWLPPAWIMLQPMLRSRRRIEIAQQWLSPEQVRIG